LHPPHKLQTAHSDVLAYYYFTHHGTPGIRSRMITPHEVDCLRKLGHEALLRGMQWHSVPAWIRVLRFWDPLSNIGIDVFVLEWLRRGLDPAYWVVQDALRRAK
jgi:hypothetical protein